MQNKQNNVWNFRVEHNALKCNLKYLGGFRSLTLSPLFFSISCNLPVHFWSGRMLWSRQMKRRIKNCFRAKWSKRKRLLKPSPKVLLIQPRVLLQNSKRENGWLIKQQTEERCLLETCLSAALFRYVGGFCLLKEWKELQQSCSPQFKGMFPTGMSHTLDWSCFWGRRKWCLFLETIRDNLWFPRVPAAVDTATLSWVEWVSSLSMKKMTEKIRTAFIKLLCF